MTHDPASFDKKALEAIYGSSPQCLVVSRYKAHDFHHILGRGPKATRKMYSSVFNAAPLNRDVHETCSLLNRSGMQDALMLQAQKHVLYAVAQGKYELTKTDQEFLDNVKMLGTD